MRYSSQSARGKSKRIYNGNLYLRIPIRASQLARVWLPTVLGRANGCAAFGSDVL